MMVSNAKKAMGTHGLDSFSVSNVVSVLLVVDDVGRVWRARFFMVCFLRVDVAN